MKKIIVLSHCILNTAAKVSQDESGLAEEYRKRDELITEILESGTQIIQLPCPEFLIYGSRRWGHVKEQFKHPHFISECKKMLEPIIMQLEEYSSYSEEFEVLGIVSVEGSPSCGYGLTCRGEWGGELESIDKIQVAMNGVAMTEEPGVYMELLEDELAKHGLHIHILDMDAAKKVIKLN